MSLLGVSGRHLRKLGVLHLLSRKSIVHAERSTAIGILLFVASSVLLQAGVVLVGQVEGDGRGKAVAANRDTGIDAAAAPARTTSSQLPAAIVGAAAQSAPAAPRGDRLALLSTGLGSHIDAITAPMDDTTPADTVIAKNLKPEPEPVVALRVETFGPAALRRPRHALSEKRAEGNADQENIAVAAKKASFVIAPSRAKAAKVASSGVQHLDRAVIVEPATSRSPRIIRGKQNAPRNNHDGLLHKVHFQDDTPERCLPPDLVGVLYDVAERFGEVQVLSTFRDSERNRRVGGAPQSYHLSCQAIDFRVTGRTSGLLDYLEKRAEVGGLKRYPLGFFHIDNGPRRTW
ncbi:MAG: DUF882 domain-containing protein [Hyphomicrobiaceae bacterium]|nr:DUF882 domain-containing protein [Hyphomicrobiaceae bacterium]